MVVKVALEGRVNNAKLMVDPFEAEEHKLAKDVDVKLSGRTEELSQDLLPFDAKLAKMLRINTILHLMGRLEPGEGLNLKMNLEQTCDDQESFKFEQFHIQ